MSNNERHWKELREESFANLAAGRSERIRALTPNQGKYLKAIETSVVTICIGPAGTGKTYMACGIAAQMLKDRRIEKIVLTRPVQECDEELGFLPGDQNEKMAEVVAPMMEALREFFSPGEVATFQREEKIIVVPLAKMRGRTFKNAVIILDEAQNATYRQLRMFLTRFGKGSRVIVNGDHTQSDLHTDRNPLYDVLMRFKSDCHQSISIVRLSREDIVRHELIQWIDERLTAAPETEGQDATTVCVNCFQTLYYPHDAEVVRCWSCNQLIELADEEGKFDPQVIEVAEDDEIVTSRGQK